MEQPDSNLEHQQHEPLMTTMDSEAAQAVPADLEHDQTMTGLLEAAMEAMEAMTVWV